MLDAFIAVNRDEIIRRCRLKVAARSGAPTISPKVEHGIPLFLDQLLEELQHKTSADASIARTAALHGHDLLVQGYTVSQVVHDYGDVCQAVTQLAVERHADISSADFQTLNRCLDDAIAAAVTEYGHERDRPNERPDTGAGEKDGPLMHDLVKAIQIARLAFEAIRSGSVGVAGSTGSVLALGLDTAGELGERLLADHSPRGEKAQRTARPVSR